MSEQEYSEQEYERLLLGEFKQDVLLNPESALKELRASRAELSTLRAENSALRKVVEAARGTEGAVRFALNTLDYELFDAEDHATIRAARVKLEHWLPLLRAALDTLGKEQR